MYKMSKKHLVFLCVGVMLLSVTSCGKSQNEGTQNSQTESQQDAQSTQETETETRIEIADANDILTKVWDTYEAEDSDGDIYNDKFAIMGGHFDTAVMDKPAKYDLTKTNDLELMYCVPQTAIVQIDDAATMVHLMRASTFTAGSYHVMDVANVKAVVDGIKQQIMGNQWLGGFPDEYMIVVVDGQYVVAMLGETEIVDNFATTLKSIYGKQAAIWVNENIR